MDTVMDLLDEKLRAGRSRPGAGCGPIGTTPDTTVREATRCMNDHGIGALIVMRDRRLAGIFTERDVLRRIVAESRSPDTTRVGEVMTVDVICCSPACAIDDVAEQMWRHRVRHVPVIDAGGDVVGMVSIGDVNVHRHAQCELALHHMEQYVHGRT